MIKAYLTCISTFFEGEDIEIRYSIFQDDELLQKESLFQNYTKPGLCGLVSVQSLLRALEKYVDEEILIVVNDGSLYEVLKGTSKTKKQEVQMLGKKIRKMLEKFPNIDIENVSGDHLRMQEWNDILKF